MKLMKPTKVIFYLVGILLCLTCCEGCPDTDTDADADEGIDMAIDTPKVDMGSGEVTFGDIDLVYVGGYVDIPVEVAASVGVPFEEITFSIEGGAFNQGGIVSRSQPTGALGYDELSDEKQVTIVGGATPGTYHLVAKTNNGSVLGRKRFELTAVWGRTDVGPPIWVQGDDINRFESDNWGVAGTGSGAAAPINGENGAGLAEHPGYTKQTGTRRVLVMMVDFEDAKFTNEEIVSTRKRWTDALLAGAFLKNNNVRLLRSVRQFYDEVSNGNLEIEGSIFGPVHLPNTTLRDIFRSAWTTQTQQIVTAALKIDRDGDGLPDILSPEHDLLEADAIVFITPIAKLDPPVCVPTADPTEICDGIDNDCDGNTDALDSELSSCSNPTCGNGIVDVNVPDGKGGMFDEECDDANESGWDYCNTKCKAKTQHYPWPAASTATYAIPIPLASLNRRYRVIKMPADWDKIDGRELVETLTHEIGHNLGLPDLYATETGYVRTMGKWDVMSTESAMGYLSLSDRIALGWVPSNKIHTFNGATTTSAYIELSNLDTYTYSFASWLAGPQKMGVEVRVARGWNYYIEYRYGATDHAGDWEPPFFNADDTKIGGHVMITERREGAKALMPPQRIVSHAPDGLNGVKGRFDAPGIYISNDLGGSSDLTVEVLSVTKSKAVLKVDYLARGADPSIRKWPSPTHRYQSPDIEVVNEKNKANSAWDNVPWSNHDNDIVATIHNEASEDAIRVKVKFSYFDFTVSRDKTPIYLGERTVDVLANISKKVTFTGWVPPSEGHYCLQVEIEPYTDPETDRPELSSTNNIAQSNYTKYWSPTASPSRRIVHDITVHNPHNIAAIAHLRIRNRSDDFRAYLSARWVRIEAGQSTKVQIAHEYIHDDFEALLKENNGEYFPNNRVDVSAWIASPERSEDSEQTEELMAGVTMDVQSGMATVIEVDLNFAPDSNVVDFKGQVLKVDGALPVPGAEVWLSVWDTRGKLVEVKQIVTDSESRFVVKFDVPDGVANVEVEYPGNHPYAPSRWQLQP